MPSFSCSFNLKEHINAPFGSDRRLAWRCPTVRRPRVGSGGHVQRMGARCVSPPKPRRGETQATTFRTLRYILLYTSSAAFHTHGVVISSTNRIPLLEQITGPCALNLHCSWAREPVKFPECRCGAAKSMLMLYSLAANGALALYGRVVRQQVHRAHNVLALVSLSSHPVPTPHAVICQKDPCSTDPKTSPTDHRLQVTGHRSPRGK